MVKRILVGLVVLLVVASVGLFFYARAILATDTVRDALAAQLSRALGQPVTVEAVSATVYPRVTVTLTGVSIGQASEITMNTIDVGTDFRALLSRRIENAALHLNGARLTLPLPPLTIGNATDAPASQPPVELVSIDEIVLSDVAIVSRGRTLRGDIDLQPHGTTALTIRTIALTADGAHIDGRGEITNLAGPVGTIDLKAGALDLDQLMAFASDFVEGSGTGSGTGAKTSRATPASSPASQPDLTLTMKADRATMGGVSIESVAGRARLQGETVRIDPLTFNLFGGSYAGALGTTLGASPTFTWKAALANVDVAAVTAFAGNPGVLTGRMAADVDLTGSGIDAATAMKTARGTARVTIANGVVQNLALVKAAVAATSLDPQAVVAASQGPHDEPFSELAATLGIAGGAASTQDLHFVSKDIRLDAAGALKLDGSAVRLTGQVQMSEELSKQADSTLGTGLAAGRAHHASGNDLGRRRQATRFRSMRPAWPSVRSRTKRRPRRRKR